MSVTDDTVTVAGRRMRHRCIPVPASLCRAVRRQDVEVRFGGDLRIGRFSEGFLPDFLVYRSLENGHDEGGMKPCFFGAFRADGQVLWQIGEGGEQPSRPGPVAVYDLAGDGVDNVICFFRSTGVAAAPTSLANVRLQVRDGRSGELLRDVHPPIFDRCAGQGANWVHQRLLVANLRGTSRPRDLVVKLGDRIAAFSEDLELLWDYRSPWSEYSRCPAYIPAVGDIDGDGCDEVLGGYALLDHDGKVLWEKQLARHMDSVAICPWDAGHARAVCSGSGHVVDSAGAVLLRLGERVVPHGQEVRVGHFLAGDSEPQMVIRWNGHAPDVIVVTTRGEIVRRLRLNESPNNTGMETIHWRGENGPDMLFNGGWLWDLDSGQGEPLPGLGPPVPFGRMAWYHCIPADVHGTGCEGMVVYNPWEAQVHIYAPVVDKGGNMYVTTLRQTNVRLMD